MGRKKKVVDLEEYKRELKSESEEKRNEGHYVPNAILLEELKRCKETGEISDDLGRMFMAIATKLSNRNIYKYPDNYQVDKKDDKGNITQVHRSLISDQNSLVYGRYFVISLMFNDKPFKLESIDINKEIY